jgi:DNA mismatch endonuclease (patch repair protein)
LPGKPDLVFPKYQAVIFVHGCFWHGHDCHLFKWPGTRKSFWRSKIERNREIDEGTLSALAEAGWRCCVVWECALKGKERLPLSKAIRYCDVWLHSRKFKLVVRGTS